MNVCGCDLSSATLGLRMCIILYNDQVLATGETSIFNRLNGRMSWLCTGSKNSICDFYIHNEIIEIKLYEIL